MSRAGNNSIRARTIRHVVTMAALTMIAAACTASAHDVADVDLSPTTTVAATAPTTATTAPAPAPQCTDTNATESYRPLTSLPRAGAMPSGSTMETIQRRGRLIAGVSADTLQFGARNPLNGQIEGFDVDMLRAVSQAIFGAPDRIEFKVITYAQRIPNLVAGNVDIVAHTMTINCVRWNTIAFSSEYYSAGQKLLVGKDLAASLGNGFTNLDDVAGKTICVGKGSTNAEELARHPDVKSLVVDDLTDCVVAFQQGLVDGITGDDTVLAGFAAQDPYAVVLAKAFTSEPYGLGMNADDVDFVRFVNAVLEQVRTTTWKTSYTKWVDPLNPAPEPPVARYGRPDAVAGT